MRLNTKDDTLKKSYIQKYQFLISEYELVKAKNHPKYSKVSEFYRAHGTCPQVFLKYYGRYRSSDGDKDSLLPGKRGPRFKIRRTPEEIERDVLLLRSNGCNKYDINSILVSRYCDSDKQAPSTSTIYNIFKRYGVNRKKVPMKEEKKVSIIKEYLGELGHIDCYHLSKDMIADDNKRYYLVCLVDSCSRIAWTEVVHDIKALTVMFATLHILNHININYDIRFKEILSDNGPEFGPKESKSKESHPFERLLIEMDIKHRYIRPYRPQTNGKVERFWRTLNEDLTEGTYFESIEHFKKELLDYMVYYNQIRPHQSLNGSTPLKFSKTCKRIT